MLCIAATIFLYWGFGAPPLSAHDRSSVSSDGKYTVDVYSEPMFFAMPGGGGAGSHDSLVILRNRWGWEIGSNRECPFFMQDVRIAWDVANNKVWVAKARAIDLRSGECPQ